MKKIITALTIAFTIFVSTENAQSQSTTSLKNIPSGEYELDKTHASIIWGVNHMGLSNYKARFTNFNAKIGFDSQNPEKSTLVAVIDPSSIKTDYPYPEKKDFDKKLIKGSDWFDTNEHKSIKFVSQVVEIDGNNKGKIKGQLTLLGVSKPIELDVVFNGAYESHPFKKKPALGFSASTKINRSEWGMDTYVPQIADEVQIDIEAEFIKAD